MNEVPLQIGKALNEKRHRASIQLDGARAPQERLEITTACTGMRARGHR